jgi:hypothetical protein
MKLWLRIPSSLISLPLMMVFLDIVDESPRQFAHGKQWLETPDWYFIPISIRNGLPYVDMHPPTDEELEAYPQVNFTSDMPWEPQVFDNEDDVTDLDISEDYLAKAEYHPALNDNGEISQYDHDDPELYTMCTVVAKVCGNKNIVGTKQHDPKRLAPNFAFVSEERILKPSIIPPNMLKWTRASLCGNILKVASLRPMSVA